MITIILFCIFSFIPAYACDNNNEISDDDGLSPKNLFSRIQEKQKKMSPFTDEEDKKLFKGIQLYKRNWKQISHVFFQDQRSAINLKNHYYYIQKKEGSHVLKFSPLSIKLCDLEISTYPFNFDLGSIYFRKNDP